MQITNSFCSSDLAVVVPTRNRPIQVKKLLASLAAQSMRPGSVILVNYSGSIEPVIAEFKDRLSVTYIQSTVPGQIHQRNIGIKAVSSNYRLVAFFDDDLVVEFDALERMIEFWNNTACSTAGVGFNIINCPPFRFSPVLSFFGLSSLIPGKVLNSGHNVSIQHVVEDVRTEWLGGGFTVWRAEILRKFRQDELRTHWAIGEDLRFSYPIGKQFPLFVCSQAKVRHEHVTNQWAGLNVQFYQGRKSVASIILFVQQFPKDFSVSACLWMLVGKCCARFVVASVRFDKASFGKAIGEAIGIFCCSLALIRKSCIRTMLED
jgi:glycosyltransferase involved in cell wall biosynthesis